MPKGFDMCVSEGGRVKTMPVKGGRHMKICFDKNGKSHPGEVGMSKQADKMMKGK